MGDIRWKGIQLRDQHRSITNRAIRMLGKYRDEMKEAYIDTYLKETGYSVEECELVETTQQVDGTIQMSWFMRKREDG